VRRLDVLTEVANALRVSLPDLFGQPVLVEDEEENDDIPAVRDALMAVRRFSRVLFRPESRSRTEPDPREIARFVEQVWFEYQAGRLGRVIAALPNLIRTAQLLEDSTDFDRRECWAVSARVHHLAATTMSKVGEVDLAWIAAERAMAAAEQVDDPLVLASAARAGAHAFLANGRYDDALSLGTTAATWLSGRMDDDDPAALSLFGMLHLRSAVAAARRQDRSEVVGLLRQAARAADRLGEDANHWQTGFGPTNVALHRLSAALDLGDVSYVVERGPRVSIDHLPAERSASHLTDLARALTLVARDDDALDRLLEAERIAPPLVRHSPVVREIAKTLHRRAPATGRARSSRLMGLAERCRAIQ
jgi:hypothetical protein